MMQESRKVATLRDVALRAGIDKATASRALNGRGYIAPATLAAAQKAARELGYEPNPAARRLAGGRLEKSVALCVVEDLGVATRTGWDLTHLLDHAGYSVDVHQMPLYRTNPQSDQESLMLSLRRLKPAALVIEDAPLTAGARKHLRAYQEEGGVLVAYGSRASGECDYVLCDESQSTYLAARHVIALGHRNIGLAQHGHVEEGQRTLRFIGFQKAMAEAGLRVRAEWLWCECCFEEAGAALARKFLKAGERPSAMCIVNDLMASVFLNYISRAGWRVPDDLSIIGQDDVPAAEHALVPLSSVARPTRALAQAVAEMVDSRLSGRYLGEPRRAEVSNELRVRESTAPPRSGTSSRGAAPK